MACDIPEKLTGPVRYPLVLLKHGAGRRSAESFYRWLASSEAAKVFEKHGFVVLQGEPRETMMLTVEEWTALRLSLQVAACATLAGLPLAVAAGYLLARGRFPASGWWRQR